MIDQYLQRAIALGSAILVFTGLAYAQSGSVRPRRVNQTPAVSQTDTNAPSSDNSTLANANAPATGAASANTSHPYSLLQQKQYAAAAKEAKGLAARYPNDPETWKIAGFAEMGLKQYQEASNDLQRALDMQRAAKQEDPNTVDALAQSYILTEKFDRALPLLVIATSRKGVAPDAAAALLYYRGVAEFRTGKAAEAERSFNAAIKANPKDAASLFYLGQIAFARNDLDAAIFALNRATIADARVASAWALLATAYLRRAASATDPAKGAADYQSAVRAAEGLTRIRTDADAFMLYAQTLIGAQQYARAAAALERVANSPDTKGATLYLLGVAHSRAKNFPKAIAALERAAAKTPDNVDVYRELGYAYENSKQYAKALAAYQKGASLAPNDTDLKESIERVKPFAK